MDDKKFEDFWFTLKRNMCNFYRNNSIIEEWSNYLNRLKTEKRYYLIQKNILKYLNRMSEDLIKNYNVFLGNIFFVNLKRWKKIINKNNFLSEYEYYYYLNDFNFIKCKFEIIVKLIEKVKIDPKEIPDYYKDGKFNYENILEVIKNYNQTVILNNLLNITDIYKYIFDKYNINCRLIKSKKIINLLKNKK